MIGKSGTSILFPPSWAEVNSTIYPYPFVIVDEIETEANDANKGTFRRETSDNFISIPTPIRHKDFVALRVFLLVDQGHDLHRCKQSLAASRNKSHLMTFGFVNQVSTYAYVESDRCQPYNEGATLGTRRHRVRHMTECPSPCHSGNSISIAVASPVDDLSRLFATHTSNGLCNLVYASLSWTKEQSAKVGFG